MPSSWDYNVIVSYRIYRDRERNRNRSDDDDETFKLFWPRIADSTCCRCCLGAEQGRREGVIVEIKNKLHKRIHTKRAENEFKLVAPKKKMFMTLFLGWFH